MQFLKIGIKIGPNGTQFFKTGAKTSNLARVSRSKCTPPMLCDCGDSIQTMEEYKIHQVHELPLVKPIVTEYQLYDGICGEKHIAKLPKGVPKGMLGPIAMAKVATLTGNYRLSKRNTVNLWEDFYGLHISIGTVSNTEKAVSLSCLESACRRDDATYSKSIRSVYG